MGVLRHRQKGGAGLGIRSETNEVRNNNDSHSRSSGCGNYFYKIMNHLLFPISANFVTTLSFRMVAVMPSRLSR